MRTRLLFCAFLGAALLLQPSNALTQPPGKGRKSESPFVPKGNKASSAKAGDLKKYDDVITKDFTTQTGVFAVHRHDDKVYFEIPAGCFRPAVPLAAPKSPRGRAGAAGAARRLATPYSSSSAAATRSTSGRSASPSAPTARRSSRPSRPPATDSIIATYSVECEGKDRSAVVNMSDVVVNSFPDLPLSRAAGGGGASIDMSRSYLSDVKAFPTNIEARALLTFRGGGGGEHSAACRRAWAAVRGSVTSLVHQSLAILPETPMQGRLLRFPRRLLHRGVHRLLVGQAVVREQGVHQPASGWRRRTPRPTVSEPVKPIVFYLVEGDPREVAAVPEAGRRGLEARVREGRVQERDRLQGRPDPGRGPELGPGGRPLLGDPLGGRAGRQRDGPARPRSAFRRDHLRPHHLLARHRQARRRCGTSCSARRMDSKARKFPLPTT